METIRPGSQSSNPTLRVFLEVSLKLQDNTISKAEGRNAKARDSRLDIGKVLTLIVNLDSGCYVS